MLDTDIFLSRNFLLIAIAALIVGYVIFLILLNLLPKKLKSENLQQHEEIIKKAKQRKQKILKESQKSIVDKLQLQKEEEEANIAYQQVDLEDTLKEI